MELTDDQKRKIELSIEFAVLHSPECVEMTIGSMHKLVEQIRDDVVSSLEELEEG